MTRVEATHILCALWTKRTDHAISQQFQIREETGQSQHKQRLTGGRPGLNINLSATMEAALAEAVKRKQSERWLAENQAAIEAYNKRVARTASSATGCGNSDAAVRRPPEPESGNTRCNTSSAGCPERASRNTQYPVVVPLYVPAAVQDGVIATLMPRIEVEWRALYRRHA